MGNFHVLGQLVDISNREIFSAEISVEKGKIVSIRKVVEDKTLPFLIPGFIDAHVHVESSMLVPSEFARLAVPHGTVATVSDPHQIANVCGMEGINYMIDNGNQVPFKFYFGAPSCVPATPFETAGAEISVRDIHVIGDGRSLIPRMERIGKAGRINLVLMGGQLVEGFPLLWGGA